MKLSMRTDYALRVLLTLAERYGREPISIGELARRNQVPKRFLEHIMLEMKAQGWVDSRMGRGGGYVLARPADTITAGEVVRHFDGVLAPIRCVSVRHYERCSRENACRFRRLFLDVRNHAAEIMDRTTLSAMLRTAPVESGEVSEPAFQHGGGI